MLAIMGMPFDLTVDFFTGAAVLCSGAAFFITKHKEKKNKDASDVIEKIFRHTEIVIKQLHEYQIEFCNTAVEFYLLKERVYSYINENGNDHETTKAAMKSGVEYKNKLVLQAYRILFYVRDGAKQGLSILKGELDYEGKSVVHKQIEYCDEFIEDTHKWFDDFDKNPEKYDSHIKNIGKLYANLLKAVILSGEHHKEKP